MEVLRCLLDGPVELIPHQQQSSIELCPRPRRHLASDEFVLGFVVVNVDFQP